MTQAITFDELANLQPKQKEFRDAVHLYKYVLYGGAAAGGKSYSLRWVGLYLLMYYSETYKIKGIRGAIFSKDYPTLKDRHLSKIKYEFPEWLGTLHKQDNEFVLADKWGGGSLLFRNLDDPSKYLSSEFAFILVDEITENPRDIFDFLALRLRWPGIPDTRFACASNPGGVGHGYIKKLFIDQDMSDENYDVKDFHYVHAKYSDNKFIDVSYEKSLNSLPDNLRRAYMEGDWDVFKGQYFTEWRRERHVIQPFQDEESIEFMKSLPTYCGLDYGYKAQSAVVWAKYYDGCWYIYRELYQSGLTYEDLMEKILEIEKPEMIFADPAIWAKKDSPTSGEMLMKKRARELGHEVVIRRGMNERVIGWNHMRTLMTEDRIKVYSSCKDLIRTIPMMIYNERAGDPEDCETKGVEDHAVDATRYLTFTFKNIEPQKTSLTYSGKGVYNKTTDKEELFESQSNNYLPSYGGKV